MGKSAYGLEASPANAQLSESLYGFEQYCESLEGFQLNRYFDAIQCYHLLEYVQDPHKFLKNCADHLTPQGQVLFEVSPFELPADNLVSDSIKGPAIHYFTRASLYHLVSQSFKLLTIGYSGSSLFVLAAKSPSGTFQKDRLSTLKIKTGIISTSAKLIHKFPLEIAGNSGRQIFMRAIFSHHNKAQTLKRSAKLGMFALRNKLYLKSEKGSGEMQAVHFSYYSGWENAGDTVLSKTVRDNFNVIRPTHWTLNKVTDPVTEDTIRLINKNNYMVIGGGGLLLPDSNPNSISGWQWAISEQLLEEIQVPVLVYAIGYNFFIGQDPGELFIRSLKQIVRKSTFFSLRNSGSIRAVKALVGDELAAKIRFQPCPTTVIRLVDKSTPRHSRSKNVGVNIAYDRYHLRYGADIYKILDQVASALKKISSKGYRIYNICHLENDSKFELTLDAHGVKYQSINLQYSLPKDTYETYCNMELVMGTRGHAQMIPFGVNTKIISLGSHNKLKWFLEDIDALEWFVNLKEGIPELCDRITSLFFEIIDSEDAQAKIDQEQMKLYEVTKANYEILEPIISQTK